MGVDVSQYSHRFIVRLSREVGLAALFGPTLGMQRRTILISIVVNKEFFKAVCSDFSSIMAHSF